MASSFAVKALVCPMLVTVSMCSIAETKNRLLNSAKECMLTVAIGADSPNDMLGRSTVTTIDITVTREEALQELDKLKINEPTNKKDKIKLRSYELILGQLDFGKRAFSQKFSEQNGGNGQLFTGNDDLIFGITMVSNYLAVVGQRIGNKYYISMASAYISSYAHWKHPADTVRVNGHPFWSLMAERNVEVIVNTLIHEITVIETERQFEDKKPYFQHLPLLKSQVWFGFFQRYLTQGYRLRRHSTGHKSVHQSETPCDNNDRDPHGDQIHIKAILSIIYA